MHDKRLIHSPSSPHINAGFTLKIAMTDSDNHIAKDETKTSSFISEAPSVI